MRRPALLVALSLCATGVTAGPAAVRAAASTASTASTAGTLTTISSSALRVSVDDGFPRVASYTDIASGAVLYGNEDTLSQVTLNGTNYTPTVSSTVATDHVDYTLTFSAFGNVAIDVTLKVTGNHLDLDVTRIADTTANPVKTLAFPSHNLVSVRSSQTGAALASAKMNTATTGTGDTFSTLTGTTQTDAAPVSSMYAIVNTGQLAASVTSNSYYDSPSGATATENGRVKKQTVDKTSYRRLGIWNGDWLYRSSGSATSDTEPLPWAKVVVTGDRNDDSTVDWQDGAIGYRDIMTSTRASRLASLKAAVPNLDFAYVDVWWGDGYLTRKLARELTAVGLDIGTEFPDKFVDDAVWTHWANDVNYGGSDYKGINSQIARFIRNHQLDDWIYGHPLLGGGELAAYEGWQGKTDYNAFIKSTFTTDLPTKYLQGSPITKWTSSTITLANGVSVTTSGNTRQISKDSHLILNGGSYLLPWDQQAESKLYHWNTAGGTTTWTLPTSWGSPAAVKLYKLTDTGRQFVQDLTVTSRQVSITATANTPYVVYPADPGPAGSANWGESSKVSDPNFYSGNLTPWTVTGDTTKASVQTTSRGNMQLQVASGNGTTVSQQLTGLTGGQTYSASVYVATSGGRKASITATPAGGTAATTWTTSSPYTNNVRGDEYNQTSMQRMRVLFDVPAGQSTATLALSADSGTTVVSVDNVRVVPVTRTSLTGHYFAEDFESVDAGWFPFVVGNAGGSATDPRTVLTQLNAPYTQAGWNGKLTDDVLNGNQSLKAHEERAGLIYRTLPQTLRFDAGRNYTVKFSYQATNSGEYNFVVGDGSTITTRTAINQARTDTTFTATVPASSTGQTFIGIEKTSTGANTQNQQHDLTIDDLIVDDAGPGGGGAGRVPQTQMTVKYAH